MKTSRELFPVRLPLEDGKSLDFKFKIAGMVKLAAFMPSLERAPVITNRSQNGMIVVPLAVFEVDPEDKSGAIDMVVTIVPAGSRLESVHPVELLGCMMHPFMGVPLALYRIFVP